MAVITDLRMRWSADSNAAIGFASIHDLRLGDLLVSDRIDKQMYLDNAWLEIESVLGQCYVVPIPEDVPQAAINQLMHIHALLASSWLLMELNVGNDTDQASFAVWMRTEVDRKLALMCDGSMDLDGVERRIDEEKFDAETGRATNIPTILTRDAASPFDLFWEFAATPVGETWDTYEAGVGLTPRPLT